MNKRELEKLIAIRDDWRETEALYKALIDLNNDHDTGIALEVRAHTTKVMTDELEKFICLVEDS